MSTAVGDWKEEARSLREQGLSEREIAESVGKSASSVHEAVKDVEPGAPPVGDPTPGQQTIDGGEVPASQNGNGQVHVEEIRVDGTTQLGLIDFGGKQPQSATVTLRGGAYELLEGKAFRKGDVLHFEGTAVVTFVGGRDKTDGKTGIVVSAKQVHEARITDLRVTGSEG